MPSARRSTSTSRRGAPTVADLVAALDAIAPFADAADWDNVGLLAGRPEWPARKWLTAIDLTDDVAREALRKRVEGVLVYHPPIFKGIRRVTPETDGPTQLLPDVLAARIAIVSTHTAFDAAVGGTNDLLLSPFDLASVTPLEAASVSGKHFKLVVFVPKPEVDALRTALSNAGAGVIGHYAECSFELEGRGSFRGDETTNPTIGRKQRLEHVDEVRLEMLAPANRLPEIVRTLIAAHSYEEPAFDLYPLHELRGRGAVGMGRVGVLRKPTRGDALLAQLGSLVDLSAAQVVGRLNRPFTRVIAAAGSFGVAAFRDPDALVITGEFKHHDALALCRCGITAIHLGHYESERPVLHALRTRLTARLPGVNISIARADASPFRSYPRPR